MKQTLSAEKKYSPLAVATLNSLDSRQTDSLYMTTEAMLCIGWHILSQLNFFNKLRNNQNASSLFISIILSNYNNSQNITYILIYFV